jgi:hypothetical protein
LKHDCHIERCVIPEFPGRSHPVKRQIHQCGLPDTRHAESDQHLASCIPARFVRFAEKLSREHGSSLVLVSSFVDFGCRRGIEIEPERFDPRCAFGFRVKRQELLCLKSIHEVLQRTADLSFLFGEFLGESVQVALTSAARHSRNAAQKSEEHHSAEDHRVF